MRIATVVVVLSAVVSAGVLAQTGDPPTVLYHLQPESTYEEGCYHECLCPILQAPMEGTFGLTWLPSNGPLDLYRVDDVDFLVPVLEKVLTGSGFYTPAGEYNEMVLELQMDGGEVMLFSSGGLVPAGAEFPDIDIVVSVNQMMSCFDYVLHIVASPVPPSDDGPVLSVSHSELSWSAVPGASGYDVVCGGLQYLRSTGNFVDSIDLCLADDHPATSISYDLTPGEGTGLWFLVREDGGSYDSWGEAQVGSRDAGIDASPLACP